MTVWWEAAIMQRTEFTHDFELLLEVLPLDLRIVLSREEGAQELIEILSVAIFNTKTRSTQRNHAIHSSLPSC